jgi:hypothetical protein
VPRIRSIAVVLVLAVLLAPAHSATLCVSAGHAAIESVDADCCHAHAEPARPELETHCADGCIDTPVLSRAAFRGRDLCQAASAEPASAAPTWTSLLPPTVRAAWDDPSPAGARLAPRAASTTVQRC